MAETELRTYRGNCHCGAFVYEAQVPEIKTVYDCNCSLCTKKGYLWVFPGRDNFKVVKGSEDALTTYAFGSKTLLHKFCPNCATAVMGVAAKPGQGMELALNARAIQGLDPWTLECAPYDGAALGEPYQPPAHKGDLPTAEIEGGKTYTGSCHCGAVTIAVVNKPLDETFQGAIECNCSSCQRNGCIWYYPKTEEVVLSGGDNIGRYNFGKGVIAKTFCRTCGVVMTNSFNPLSQEEFDALPTQAKEWCNENSGKNPVNARTLHGVDLAKLETYKFDGATGVLPLYVNP